jgi:hypothetical protein|tara:strand:- start:1405 stop:1584 length:180 start_codon:yes stop_codon:yes gene_type:complete
MSKLEEAKEIFRINSIWNQVIERIKLSLISYTENDTWNDAIDEIVKDEWKKHLREKENE